MKKRCLILLSLIFCNVMQAMEFPVWWFPVRETVDKYEYREALNTEALAKILQAIHRGADANAWNCFGKTPLMIAVEQGQFGVVQSLLAIPGIQIDKQNLYRYTALMHAKEKGHAEVVEELIKHGAKEKSVIDALAMEEFLEKKRNQYYYPENALSVSKKD